MNELLEALLTLLYLGALVVGFILLIYFLSVGVLQVFGNF
jgi:hypothetical protein